ncbi:MAG TPA: GAF domain-containing protein [Bacteroidales bacterium]|nr:GAF domain-containing protein [Bacteroidales bacterium]
MNLRFSIGAKLLLGIGAIIIAILINSYLINNSLEKSRKINNQITQLYVPSASHLNDLYNQVNQSKSLIKTWVFIDKKKNTPDKTQLKKLHNQDFPQLNEKIQELSQAWEPEEREKYQQIHTTIKDTLFKRHQSIMESLNNFDSYNDPMLLFEITPQVEYGGEIIVMTDELLQEISALRNTMQSKVDESRLQMTSIFNKFERFIMILGIALILISSIIALILTRTTVRPINRVKGILNSMCLGVLPNQKLKVRNDEIGDMSSALNDLIDSFRKFTSFAKEIGKGNYNVRFEPLSEQDDLGNALLEMRDNLKKAAEEDEKRQTEDEQRNWASQGIARFSELLRENNDNLEELSYQIIQNLVKYTNANQGGLFLLNHEDEDQSLIELKAAYAYSRRKYLDKHIEPGVGLVGRAVQEGETIYMTEIPDNYITISSGLGDANPRSLLIVPLKTNDEVHGVIEMASFETFQPYQIEFVERVAENIASTLSTVKINIRTNELLEKSQQQAEEMKAQEEEMRQNMEELKATQEESSRREKELKDKLDDCQDRLNKYIGRN